jgi:hypothetical protein
VKTSPIIFCFIIIGCVLLTTGCISQNPTQNSSGSSVTNTPVSTLQTPCPAISGNDKPYIIINPISNHFLGDVFEINGTTNIGVGEKLHYSVSSFPIVIVIPVPTGCSVCSGERYIPGTEIAQGDISIAKDECNRQKWSFWLNTSGSGYHNSYGASFILNVTFQNMTLYNSTSFDLNIKG